MKTRMIKRTLVLSIAMILGVFVLYSFQQPAMNTKTQKTHKIKKNHAYTGDVAISSTWKSDRCGSGKENVIKMILEKDSDGDGKVSWSEYQEGIMFIFPKLDQNHDGKITRNECEMFDEFNTDGDDHLTREEYFVGHKMLFKKYDTNHDGKIDSSEVKELDLDNKKYHGKSIKSNRGSINHRNTGTYNPSAKCGISPKCGKSKKARKRVKKYKHKRVRR